MPYYWNPNLARYQDADTGQIVSYRNTILPYVTESVNAAMTAPAVTEGGVLSAGAATLANLTTAGLVSPDDFQNLLWGEIKREHIRQYLLGIGGRDQMTPADWGSIGGMLSEQKKYFNGFIDAIATGDLTEGQIANRASMYLNSAREAFEKANRKVNLAAGYDEVLWVLNPPAENCVGCQEFAGLGWQKVEDDPYGGCVPGSGCTPCLTACQCHQEFRKSEEAE